MPSFITTKNLILLTTFLSPVYLLRFSIFNFPTNALDILMTITIFYWLFTTKKIFLKLKNLVKNNLVLASSVFLLFLGLFISTFFNPNLIHELGIIKSWFILPLIFSTIILFECTNKNILLEILNSIFYSSLIISIISIFYWATSQLTYDSRLQAFYLSPNHLALAIAPGVLIGVWKVINKHSYTNLILLSILTIFITNYLTYSYSSFLALAISLLFLFCLSFPKKNKKLIAASLFISFIFLVMIIYPSEKFQSLINLEERSSLSSRIAIWQSSYKILSDHWFVGIGPGNFQQYYLDYQKYFPPYLEWAVPQPHNIFLAFWIQTGFLGFAGFLLLIICWTLQIKKILNYSKDLFKKKMAILILAILTYILVYGLFDTPYWKNDSALFFWILITMGISLSNYYSLKSDSK